MSALLFILLLLACWAAYYASVRYRVKKMEQAQYIHSDHPFIKAVLLDNALLVGLLLLLLFAAVACHSLLTRLPGLPYFNLGGIGLAGPLLIKLAMIWQVVCAMEISRRFADTSAAMPVRHLYNAESLGLLGIFLLIAGGFLYLPSPATLLLVMAALYLLYRNKKRFKPYMEH